MSRLFEELDRCTTPMGELTLRRRLEPTLRVDVYEAILGEEHLMSSLFTVAERALADLALPEVDAPALDVVVGGLGLGYTASAALGDARVRSVHVVEALPEVIAWHDRGLLPLSPDLAADERCHLVPGDFFVMVERDLPFGPTAPAQVHAVLLDIDHTPQHHLHPRHAAFYREDGLRRLASRLHPGGVFALWSDAPPHDGFASSVTGVFGGCVSHVVAFPNPHTGREATNTVYVARR